MSRSSLAAAATYGAGAAVAAAHPVRISLASWSGVVPGGGITGTARNVRPLGSRSARHGNVGASFPKFSVPAG